MFYMHLYPTIAFLGFCLPVVSNSLCEIIGQNPTIQSSPPCSVYSVWINREECKWHIMHLSKFIKFDKGNSQPNCKQRTSRCQPLINERTSAVTYLIAFISVFAFFLTSDFLKICFGVLIFICLFLVSFHFKPSVVNIHWYISFRCTI